MADAADLQEEEALGKAYDAKLINVDGADLPAVFQPWAIQPAGVVAGQIQYADGAGGNLDGCAPFAPGSLTGLIVLVDRGNCNFSLKILNVELGGGAAGIIGLVAPGAQPTR